MGAAVFSRLMDTGCRVLVIEQVMVEPAEPGVIVSVLPARVPPVQDQSLAEYDPRLPPPRASDSE